MSKFLKWIFRRNNKANEGVGVSQPSVTPGEPILPNYQTQTPTDVSPDKKSKKLNLKSKGAKYKKRKVKTVGHLTADDTRKNRAVVASVNRFVLTDASTKSDVAATVDGLVLTDPKRISWKQKDAFVYTVQSSNLQSTDSELEFVIYIPIDTAVHWLDTGDSGEGGKDGSGRGDPDDSLSKDIYGNKGRKGGGLDDNDGTDRSKGQNGWGKDEKPWGDDSDKLKGNPGREVSKKGSRSSGGSEASKKSRRSGQGKDKDGAKNKGGRSGDDGDGWSKGKSENGTRKKGEKSSSDDSDDNRFKNKYYPGAGKKGGKGRPTDDNGDLIKGKLGGKRKKGGTSTDESDDRFNGKPISKRSKGESSSNGDEDRLKKKPRKKQNKLEPPSDVNENEGEYAKYTKPTEDSKAKKAAILERQPPGKESKDEGEDDRSGVKKKKPKKAQVKEKTKTDGDGNENDEEKPKRKTKKKRKSKDEIEDEDAIERKRKKAERRQKQLEKQKQSEESPSELSYGPFEVYLRHPMQYRNLDQMPPERVDMHHLVPRNTM